ncbi:hypothetical protein [Haloferula helveola]
MAPLVATAVGPVAFVVLWLVDQLRYVRVPPGGGPLDLYWRDVLEVFLAVAVVFHPTLFLAYLIFHLLVRRKVVGRFKRPYLTFSLAGGGMLGVLLLFAMLVIGLTCSDDRWVSWEWLDVWIRHLATWEGASFYLGCVFISSMMLGLAAGIFLPPPMPGQGRQPIKRRLLISAGLFITVLISAWAPVYFIWKRGSDRAGCIMNIRNVQQALRSYQGMNSSELAPKEKLVGPGLFIEVEPECPRGGTYSWHQVGWNMGQLMLRCSCEEHVPPNHKDW